MVWRAVKTFADREDSYHIYAVGDKFPHSGVVVNEDRIKQLSTSENALGMPVIVAEKTEDMSGPKSVEGKRKGRKKKNIETE